MSKKKENEPNDLKKTLSDSKDSPSAQKPEKPRPEEVQVEKSEESVNLKDNIVNLNKELGVLKEKNLRLLADLVNQREVYEKELTESLKYGNERLLQQLLFFPDSYERAMQFSQDEQDSKIKNFLTGFQMVLSEFQNFLKKQGVEEIKINPQKDVYDSKLHNALEVEENNDFPEGTILELLQKGYQIHQRVLRPAKVKISKKINKQN